MLVSSTAKGAAVVAEWATGGLQWPELPCNTRKLRKTREHLSGHKLTAVTAAKKTKKTTRRVTLGEVPYTLTGGATITITVTLGKTGQRLLATHHKLPAKISLTDTRSTTAAVTKIITITPRKAKH